MHLLFLAALLATAIGLGFLGWVTRDEE